MNKVLFAAAKNYVTVRDIINQQLDDCGLGWKVVHLTTTAADLGYPFSLLN